MSIIINHLRLLPLDCPRVTVMKTVDLIKTHLHHFRAELDNDF